MHALTSRRNWRWRRAELEEPVAEDLELAPHQVVLAGDEGAERALEEEARRVRLEQVVLEALRRDLLEDVRGLVVALELQGLDARGLERALAAPAVLRLVVQALRGRAVRLELKRERAAAVRLQAAERRRARRVPFRRHVQALREPPLFSRFSDGLARSASF